NDEVVELVDQFNVSMKLSNSGMSYTKRVKESATLFFAGNPKARFKFVIMNEGDIKEVQAIQERFNIPAGKILLMPEGRTEEEIKEHAKIVVDTCMSNGYTFCNRLHIWLWGGEAREV
ncbi:hypothetical protein LCGC14_1469350, partial [marine sediment metagenome]